MRKPLPRRTRGGVFAELTVVWMTYCLRLVSAALLCGCVGVVDRAKGGDPASPPLDGASEPEPALPPAPTPGPNAEPEVHPAPNDHPTPPAEPEPTTGLFVGPSGSDTNPGTKDRPWRTLGHAVAQLHAGDTLHVRGGVYVEAVRVSASGTPTAPITVRAYPGEHVVIDGEHRLPEGDWEALLALSGSYVHVSGFEVRNTAEHDNKGVELGGAHNVVSRMNVHHTHSIAVHAAGDYSVVEDSRIWEGTRVNAGGVCQPVGEPIRCIWGTGVSAARDPDDGITEGAILRRNVVFNNWGEGLSTFEARGTLIEDNVVFNNWSVNLYVSDTWDAVVRRNLIYVTSDTPIVGARRVPANFSLMDEVATAQRNSAIHPRSRNNVIVNNLVLGSSVCLMCWCTDEAAADGCGLIDVLFAHNTIVDASISVGSYANSGSSLVNNLVPAGAALASRSGVDASHNLASDAQLRRVGAFSNTTWSPAFFEPVPGASVIGAAQAGVVTDDYSGASRDGAPDIGAIEHRP